MKYLVVSRSLLACLFMLLTVSAANAAEVKLYKWVDSDGKVSYQDVPPPDGQNFEEKSFTDQGADTQRNIEVSRDSAARDNPVTLYIINECESCDLVRTILDLNQVPYQQIDIEADTDATKELAKIAGSARVPTLTIGDEVISGFNRNLIEDTLKEQGYPVAKQVVQ